MAGDLDSELISRTLRALADDPPEGTVSALMAEVAALCGPAGAAAAGLDYAADLDAMERWLGAVVEAEPPGDDIVAFYFGIVELAGDGADGARSGGTDLYLSGSVGFDSDDDRCEWAVGPEYFPEGRYAGSAAMRALGRIGAAGPAGAAELLTGAYAILAVTDLCQALGPDVLLGASGHPRAVATGHDGGGAWLLGAVTVDGWMVFGEAGGGD